jgi:hypothetical protein
MLTDYWDYEVVMCGKQHKLPSTPSWDYYHDLVRNHDGLSMLVVESTFDRKEPRTTFGVTAWAEAQKLGAASAWVFSRTAYAMGRIKLQAINEQIARARREERVRSGSAGEFILLDPIVIFRRGED